MQTTLKNAIIGNFLIKQNCGQSLNTHLNGLSNGIFYDVLSLVQLTLKK